MKNEIRYADLFGGVGGFRKGIGDRGKCVFYSDIDKYSVQTYNKNFNENHKPTDIRSISTDDIPEIDMLCGGFPCQAFSIAGKRRGFQDTRGTLFFEIARIIKAKKPKIIFLENVKGLLNHNKGETFKTILQTISELGYDVQWMVLNSKFFGVPQNRERVFIIGSLRGTSKSEILPFRESYKYINERDAPGIPTSQSLRAGYYKGGQGTHISNQGQRVYSPEGISKTISDGGGQGAKTGLYMMGNYQYETEKRKHEIEPELVSAFLRLWLKKSGLTKKQVCEKIEQPFTQGEHYFRVSGGGLAIPDKETWLKLKEVLKFDNVFDNQMTEYVSYITSKHQGNRIYNSNGQAQTLNSTIESMIMINSATKKGYSEATIGDGIRLEYPESKTARGRVIKQNANTLKKGTEGVVDKDMKIRRLTPTECERLQGFPDGWTEGLSDTQRYKQMGNAVTVNVIEAIARKLLKNLTKSEVKHQEVT